MEKKVNPYEGLDTPGRLRITQIGLLSFWFTKHPTLWLSTCLGLYIHVQLPFSISNVSSGEGCKWKGRVAESRVYKTGLLEKIRDITRIEGIKGMYKGTLLEYYKVASSISIDFMTYETLKMLLTRLY